MNSETPETDKQAYRATVVGGYYGMEKCEPGHGSFVPIDFARRLELRNRRLVQLVQSVTVGTFEISCADVNSKNWFDARDEALTDQQEEKR